MSNNILKDFEEDPFFSDPFRAHREHMMQMMRSFSGQFGFPFGRSITDGRNHGDRDMVEQPRPSFDQRNECRDMSRSLLPFGSTGSTDMMQNHFSMFDSMMSNMRKGMEDFDVSPNADGHSFKSSSVMSYSKVGDEPPKMFQATTSTRCAPGGIKETRKAVKDTDSGLQKMKIGHQIKDREHVVEKRHNMQTGEEEIKQDFMNMDESEAASFNNEWKQKVSGLLSPDPMPGPMQPQLEGPEQPRRGHRKRKAGRKGSGNTDEYEN
ncbi:myeloid leukemia factor 1 isoform X2 [Gambusia affinis]|uniref:myeloid leukemia factor 1 isoform X2 n=1 Tax=Gambusia affinis TaxID=33528 RepID=UPI001CDC200F|nr:myeloid leukemia factor 1 isoform X2 [Gambusia affinis]